MRRGKRLTAVNRPISTKDTDGFGGYDAPPVEKTPQMQEWACSTGYPQTVINIFRTPRGRPPERGYLSAYGRSPG